MILLTVIAVGLLTLSSISLRSAGQGNAMATARANAKLALMLAIGDLQKNAGPDQRITARADILPTNQTKNPRLTGVWKSWDIKATAPPSATEYEKTARDGKFLGWLTSSVDGKATNQIDFVDNVLTTTGTPATAVALWDKGTLGKAATATDIVLATKIPTSPTRGALAWAVMDEGVKVRINTPYVDGATTVGMKTAQLGSGERPNTALISDPIDKTKHPLEKLERPLFLQGSAGFAQMEKGISRLNLGLAAETLVAGTGTALKPLSHDVTSSSIGLFTDTAIGGLKEDFSLLTNTATLPSTYSGKGVYVSRLAMKAADALSDPRWESLQQYARIYQDTTRLTSSGGLPVLKAGVPSGWMAASGSNPTTGVTGTILRNPPAGVILMPTIAKVQIVFSLLARDIYTYGGKAGDPIPETAPQLHGNWANNFRNSSYDYLLHLLYTPVVTLHNPYNVAIEFTNMKVVFGNVPFALQVYRNGQAMTTALAPLDQMYYFPDSEAGKLSKRFGMALKTNGGSVANPAPGAPTFRLLPGEVKMFSPYIDPTRTWAMECSSGPNDRVFSDWDNGQGLKKSNRSLTLDGIPGWPGDGIGFDLDWFCPKPMRVSADEFENGKKMNRGGCIPLRRQDEIHVLFAPLNLAISNNKFTVEMFANSGLSTDEKAVVSSGAIEMDYESPTGLQDFLIGKNGTLRYPKTGTKTTLQLLDHSSTPIGKILNSKAFALLSARAKTTFGGSDPTNDDGRLATKPWCFAHATTGAVSEKIVSEHPANHSHEIDLQLLQNGSANVMQVDSQSRSSFITGNTAFNGVKFGSQYEIPLAPLQTLSSLNGANPGGSSGYLPRFAQPIGNSWAHPLIAPNKITGAYLDHSFLLNLALYDHYYFSGLADQTGPFGTGKVTATLAATFAAGKSLDDPRLLLYTPNGQAASDLKGDLAKTLPQTRIASWQVMNGAFNINSTSVAAWKAMLGSVHDSQAMVNKITKGSATVKGSSALAALKATATGESRISRFRLPASDSAAGGADPADGFWLGPREYSDAQLQTLAEKIVDQVRLRGPFLSMSEFVNRRLGTGETAQRGALQQAIDDSNVNTNIATGAKAGFDIPAATVASYKYQNAKAGAGPSYQGAPGYLSQADILGVLGNAATPRSDTFTIRGYGEARDAANKVVLASATCEAIIQRVPDYIDPKDQAEIAPASLTSTANITFGRRFNVVSFRWLNQNEI